MRIGILSDTHDQFARTSLAVQMLKSEGAEVLFHCGDLVQPAMVAECAVMPCYFVFGNNDYYFAPQIKNVITENEGSVCLEWGGEVELEGKRIAITHSHSEMEVRRLLAAEPDYLFSGHSHIAADWKEGKTRRINPGALHRASSFSVAVLDLQDASLRFLNVPRQARGTV